jgi:ABC-type transport system substrate-binding protein
MVIFCQGEDYQYPANPAWVSSAVTWDQLDYIYDGLIGLNPYNLKDSYNPDALDITLDPDWPETPGYYVEYPWTVTDGPAAGDEGMVITFYLNTTVPRYWHDGHQFDIYDIAFAWEFLAANAVPRAWGTMQYLHHVTVHNDTTISAYITTTGLTLPYGL